MGLSRIQRLWKAIYELRIVLNENPVMPVDKARALAQDIEKLAMKMRLREIKEKLRR
jgi:hypothetical protein